MSPASRSKSKDKKICKETQKPALKSSVTANAGSNIPTSAYNPLLGTFHTLEFSSSAAPAIQTNGRFRNIDDDEHLGIAITAGAEYDSVSNNGSWSGESEGHKTSNSMVRQETVPGADNDKREKTRLKNEKKHQRQKEKRAQELLERCTGYLMSRKLESLAQQLVAMGFSQEQATAALVSNEGKVEESVAWLFEGGEEVKQPRDQNLTGGGLKIDISEELARISDLELRFKCSKQEVERAIVASEGDFEQALESLRDLKLDLPSDPPKPEETIESSTTSNHHPSNGSATKSLLAKANSHTIQLRKDEKDFNYTKTTLIGGSTEPTNKGVQPLKRMPKLEWAKLQQTALPSEKRWMNPVSNPPPYSLTSSSSSLQATPLPTKPETRYVAGASMELKNLHSSSVREPIIMVQRPQSISANQILATGSMSSSPPGGANNWGSSNGIEILKPTGFIPEVHSARSLNLNNYTGNPLYHQFQHHQQPQFIPSNFNGGGEFHQHNRANNSWGRPSASPTVAAASSLGLFSGMGSIGSSGASSPVDWNTGGSMLHMDYTNIDWSLNKGLPSPRGASGLLQGFGSFVKNNGHMTDSNVTRAEIQPLMMRPTPNFNGVSLSGLQEDRVASVKDSSNAGMRVWSLPLEEKNIFSLPRQFVSSPPL